MFNDETCRNLCNIWFCYDSKITHENLSYIQNMLHSQIILDTTSIVMKTIWPNHNNNNNVFEEIRCNCCDVKHDKCKLIYYKTHIKSFGDGSYGCLSIFLGGSRGLLGVEQGNDRSIYSINKKPEPSVHKEILISIDPN